MAKTVQNSAKSENNRPSKSFKIEEETETASESESADEEQFDESQDEEDFSEDYDSEEREEEHSSNGADSDAESDVEKMSKKEKQAALMNSAKQTLRNELSQMTFAEIQQLQNKLGLKKFREVMQETRRQSNEEMSSSAASSSDTKPNAFKRLNKNRPREMSSKRPVSKFRAVFNAKKQEHIDPRFNPALGEYRPEVFRKQYAFVNDMRKNEIEMLKKEFKSEEDSERRAQIKQALTRLKQQVETFQENERKVRLKENFKKMAKEEANQGKKPIFMNKSEQKILELADKYKELKKSGKVEKFLAKKRKKQLSKDKQRLDRNQHTKFF